MTKIASSNMRVYKLFKHQLQMTESGICRKEIIYTSHCVLVNTQTPLNKNIKTVQSTYLPMSMIKMLRKRLSTTLIYCYYT